MNINLVINDNSQSFRVRSLVDNIIDCMCELCVSVRSNANKNRPVIRERKWYVVFHYNLVKEDCDCKIVVAESGANLMLNMLTFEKDGTPDLWN